MATETTQLGNLLKQALHHHQAGELDAAAALYQQILMQAPAHADALHLLGLIHYASEDFITASELIHRAIVSSAEDPVFHFNLGNVYHAAGDYNAAIAAFKTAIRLQANEADYHNNLGNVFEETGDFEQALACYQHAAALRPDDAELQLNLANTLRALQRNDEARIAYSHALALAPDFAHAHSALAELLSKSGDHSGALTHYKLAVEFAPTEADQWADLGTTLQRLGQHEDAAECYQQALQLEPAHAQALNNLGSLLQTAGDIEGALRCYRTAVATNPDLAEAHRNYAGLLQASGQHDQAIAHYQQALRLKPDYAEVAFILAGLQGESVPTTAPAEYVAALFDQYAEEFDTHLTGMLGYRTPQVLRELFDRFVSACDLRILDLGCGTGLSGMAFRDIAAELVGVDLSPRMIDMAAQRNIYNELIVDEINSVLEQRANYWDLLVAADVFVYIGDCDTTLRAARSALRSGGWLLFSVEASDTGNFVLRQSGRYAHGESYFQTLASRYGFTIRAQEKTVLRQNQGRDVEGWLFALQTNSNEA